MYIIRHMLITKISLIFYRRFKDILVGEVEELCAASNCTHPGTLYIYIYIYIYI